MPEGPCRRVPLQLIIAALLVLSMTMISALSHVLRVY